MSRALGSQGIYQRHWKHPQYLPNWYCYTSESCLNYPPCWACTLEPSGEPLKNQCLENVQSRVRTTGLDVLASSSGGLGDLFPFKLSSQPLLRNLTRMRTSDQACWTSSCFPNKHIMSGKALMTLPGPHFPYKLSLQQTEVITFGPEGR